MLGKEKAGEPYREQGQDEEDRHSVVTGTKGAHPPKCITRLENPRGFGASGIPAWAG